MDVVILTARFFSLLSKRLVRPKLTRLLSDSENETCAASLAKLIGQSCSNGGIFIPLREGLFTKVESKDGEASRKKYFQLQYLAKYV
jgi:hypothetical protein